MREYRELFVVFFRWIHERDVNTQRAAGDTCVLLILLHSANVMTLVETLSRLAGRETMLYDLAKGFAVPIVVMALAYCRYFIGRSDSLETEFPVERRASRIAAGTYLVGTVATFVAAYAF